MVGGNEPSPALPDSSTSDTEATTIVTSAATSTAIPAPATAKTTARATVAAPRQQPPRKRRRIIISCTECHRRKQKCDRALPCTNCVLRNKQDSCRYEAAAPTAKRAREYGGPTPTNRPTVGSDGEEEDGDDNNGGDDGVGDGGEEQQHKRRVPGRRPSKYDVDPRLMATVPDAGVGAGAGGAEDEGGSPGAMLVGSGGGGGNGDVANFGYAGMGASTLGFLKRIDDVQTPGESLSSLAMGRENTAYFGTRERYKSLVRQLPARPYIEKLVDIYFKDFNWQYNVGSVVLSSSFLPCFIGTADISPLGRRPVCLRQADGRVV